MADDTILADALTYQTQVIQARAGAGLFDFIILSRLTHIDAP
jgi:hypothetical protein